MTNGTMDVGKIPDSRTRGHGTTFFLPLQARREMAAHLFNVIAHVQVRLRRVACPFEDEGHCKDTAV